MKIRLLLYGLFFCGALQAETVCFTPNQNCTSEIVAIINKAKTNIYVQAYSFTSRPIINALVQAAGRGVKVSVILDKSEFEGRYYSPVRLFLAHHISVWEDDRVDIAHNKVIIIDQAIIETGSFNFTTAAQRYNAENVLILDDEILAKKYLMNWYYRQGQSRLIESNGLK